MMFLSVLKQRAACLGGMLWAIGVVMMFGWSVNVAHSATAAQFLEKEGWFKKLDWVGGYSGTAWLEQTGQGLCFRSPDGKMMSWRKVIPSVEAEGARVALVRYRAAGLVDERSYALRLTACGGFTALRFDQLENDGQWHTLAMDVADLFEDGSFCELTVFISAQREDAYLEIGQFELAAQLEQPGCLIQDTLAQEDWTFESKDGHAWAGDQCTTPQGMLCEVKEARGTGFWKYQYAQPMDHTQYRYLTYEVRLEEPVESGTYKIIFYGQKNQGDAPVPFYMDQGLLSMECTRWRRQVVSLDASLHLGKIEGVALQILAGNEPVRMQTRNWRLTTRRPPAALDEGADLGPVTEPKEGSSFQTLDLSYAANMPVEQAVRWFNLKDWFEAPLVNAGGIDFRVSTAGPGVCATTMVPESQVTVPLQGRTNELYLLVLARMIEREEFVYMSDYYQYPGPLKCLRQVDRFRVIVEYVDGFEQQTLPARLPSEDYGVLEGLNLLTLPADPARELKSLTLYDGTDQTVLGLAGVTLNGQALPRYAHLWQAEAQPVAAPVEWSEPEDTRRATLQGDELVLEDGLVRAVFDLKQGAALTRLHAKALGMQCVRPQSVRPLFDVSVSSGSMNLATAFEPVEAKVLEDGASAKMLYRDAELALEVGVTLSLAGAGALQVDMELVNRGEEQRMVQAAGPNLPALCLGDPQQMWYLIPASESVLNHKPITYSGVYSGIQMSLQFLDTFDPKAGAGLCYLVKDRQLLEKEYHLRRDGEGVTMGLTYFRVPLEAGASFSLAPTQLALHKGDWRDGMQLYRDWAAQWYEPVAPRPQWWRETFNLRQIFLHIIDPTTDPVTREYKVRQAVEKADKAFGGVDFVHFFDWGFAGPYGRTYGRIGDFDPGETYDTGYYLPGGRKAFKAAVDELAADKYRLGYYIEGYLLNLNGKIGQKHGRQWQMIDMNGNGMGWPDSPEINICPWVAPWQDLVGKTYVKMIDQMDADGLYIDQFGSAGTVWKQCWSPDHGHPVPCNSLQGEAQMTRVIREAMSTAKPQCVLYTEYTPVDVVSQYQEGGFSYSIQRQQNSDSLIPLKMFRFAYPSFKNFEILRCDTPTGTWATGVRWTFWNGCGLWLEGDSDDFFTEQTRREIRQCHRVLRQYRQAFAGGQAQPLVPTLSAAVYANRFSGQGQTVYTLYNAGYTTYQGPVLALPHASGVTYREAFSDRPVAVTTHDGVDHIELAIAPQGVACLALEQQ